MATPEEQAINAAKLAEKEGAIAAEKERYNKALEKSNMLNKSAQEIAAEELRLKTEINTIEQQSRDLMAERATQAQEQLEAVNAKIAAQAKLNDQAQGLTVAERQRLNDEIAANEQIITQKKQLLEESKNISESLSNQTSELKNQKSSIDKVLATQKKYGNDVVKNLDDAKEAANSFSEIFSDLAGDIPVIGSSITKMLNMFAKAPDTLDRIAKAGANMGGTLGPVIQRAAEGMSSFLAGIPKPALIANLAVLAIAGVAAKVALNIDNLSKEIGKATGFGNKFTHTIKAMGVEGNLMGIGFKESADALKALTTGLSSFNPNAEKTNMNVGMTVAKLEKLGVSAAASVKSIDHMQRAMGMTAKQAADATAQLARMGKEIGISGTKMINDFNAASGRLAIYGKQNIKVFKQLAAQAKATGIEMQSLLAISKNFDTFDAAAESAGKLNAVLGTQLSTIEMMNATDSERIMILKQEVQASVGNFDSLDKFTKQYVQQAMGVASVDEAQRLLNMSTSEYQKYQDGQKESADIQKELSEAVAEMVPLMTQLKLVAIQLFMVFEPLISGFSALFAGVNYLYTGFVGLFDGMGMGVKLATALKFIFTALSIAAVALAGFISWPVAAILALVAAAGALWDIFHKPGSFSMAEGMFDKDIGSSMSKMGSDAQGAQNDISNLSTEMEGMHDAAHKGAGGTIDIQAMANLDTSAIAAGFDKIKSAVMELSSVKIDGFLAMTTDGTSSSFVMGSDGLIKSISEGKLVVDVKMPEMQMPDVSVKVYIGNRELKDIIRTEVKAVVGRAG